MNLEAEVRNEYQELPSGKDGSLISRELKLRLVPAGQSLKLIDLDTGETLLAPEEMFQANADLIRQLELSGKRAELAAKQVEDARRRAEQAEAARADALKQAMDADRRAEEETRLRKEEARRADDAVRHAEELQRELDRLRGRIGPSDQQPSQ